LNEIVKTAKKERDAEAKKMREKIREMERKSKSRKEIEQLEEKRLTSLDVIKQSFADFSQL
jgi:very-short-patch-repair endonuclease